MNTFFTLARVYRFNYLIKLNINSSKNRKFTKKKSFMNHSYSCISLTIFVFMHFINYRFQIVKADCNKYCPQQNDSFKSDISDI